MRNSTRRIRQRLLLIGFSSLTLLATAAADACPNCPTSVSVWSEVQANSPGSVLGILTVAFCVVAGLIVLTARLVHQARLLLAGTLLMGAGLGAFIDGIALHQVLQWHAMISTVVEPVDLVSSKVNMFWDGVFHLYSWVATVAALVIVVRELPRARAEVRTRTVLGGALAGWGFFNFVEGLIDHHIFGFHHVHPGEHQLAWDVGFLAFGALLIAGGLLMAVPLLRDRP